jgi:hypothetical protein
MQEDEAEEKMAELSLFNIGFRSENIYQALVEYEKTNSVQIVIFEDSNEIIKDCFKFREKVEANLQYSKHTLVDLLPLIIEIFKNEEPEEIEKTFVEVGNTIQAIQKGQKNISVERTKSFFSQLSNLCLSKNNSLSQNSLF